ncbi:hypothetical protein JXA88_06240 [Candidatus Fermentibacteria bacterium]|nr:hypothetical protein [Candidatus Fermentibacteria bacterium]
MRTALAISILAMVVCLAGAPGLHADPSDLTVDVRISPSTIVIGAPGDWVTAHADIPYSSVNTATVALDGIPAAWTKADARGNLVAKFARADVEAIVAPPSAVLTLAGMTDDGVPFAGSDLVTVVVREMR